MARLDITSKFKEYKKVYDANTEKQGIKKESIELVMNKMGMTKDSYINCIWAMLDDKLNNLIDNKMKFKDGAKVAEIGGYLAILLADAEIKKDREQVRDYIIKPLIDIGAVEPITYLKKDNEKVKVENDGFYVGHLVPKSPNLAYRLHESFVDLLKEVGNNDFEEKFNKWTSTDCKNERINIILEKEKRNKSLLIIDGHAALINDSIELYAKHYLSEYVVIYKDDSDGDRVNHNERQMLDKHGIVFGGLDNVWPDVILYNEKEEKLAFIEAVTSDGEVDNAKLAGLYKICKDSNKKFGEAVTTYQDYKTYAKRQKSNKNIALNTYIWIEEDPSKRMYVC